MIPNIISIATTKVVTPTATVLKSNKSLLAVVGMIWLYLGNKLTPCF